MTLLFSPLKVRGIDFKNRIFVSPMCQYACAGDGVPTAWHTTHLGSRAVGGAALVMTEATAVCPEGRISPQDTGLYNDAQEAAFAGLAKTIRELGAVPGIQIAHAGRKGSTQPPWLGRGAVELNHGGWEVSGPTDVAYAEGYPVAKAMTEPQVAATVQQFADTAQRALRAGFQVAEVHLAHGYLGAQFLAPEINTRTDAYGGPALENRARFSLEVTEAVRAVWPDHLPLFARLSVTNWVDLLRDTRESVQVAAWLRERGVDLIDCSSGGGVAIAKIPVGPGYQVPLAEAVKRGAHVLTGAVGLITEAQQAENVLKAGSADAIFLARALLKDPYWPLRAAQALDAPMQWPLQYQRAI